MNKRLLSLLLALTMGASLLSVGVLASEDPETAEPAEVQDILEMTEAAEEEPTAAAESTEAEAPMEEVGENVPAEDAEILEIEASGEITETISEEAAMAATASGSCGDNVTWTLEDGTLTVSGTGAMEIEYEDATTSRPIIPWASYCESVTAVVIESGVTDIPLQAFQGCENLTKITIPDSVTNIAFFDEFSCASLTAFEVAAGNAEFASEDGVLYNKDKTRLLIYPTGKASASFTIPDGVTDIWRSAFADCTGLTSVTIPDSVTYIGFGAFSGCTGLTGITIPDSVTQIGYEAFSGCASLANVTFEGSVTYIGDNAFAGTPWLAAQGDFLIVNHDLIKYYGTDSTVVIPDDVTRIRSYAFEGCKSLTSVTIPNSVTNIQTEAFDGCTNLAEVSLPDSVIIDGISAFGSGYYWKAPWLTEQEEKQGDFLILGASLLAYRGSGGAVVIPDNVMSIGYNAFEDCAGLTSVTIPSSVKSIRGRAFDGCTGLTSVTVPDSVTDLGWNVFNGCTGLVSAKLPGSLTEVPPGTFCGCTNLREVNIPGGVTEIGIGAFESCASLTGVTLPNGLTSINGGAFQKCAGLTEATIPASVTDVAYAAFADCTSLTTVTFDGDAPSAYLPWGNGDQDGDEYVDYTPFAGVTATASYYDDAEGWTEDAKAAFGGNLTWVSLGSRYLYNSDKSFSAAKENNAAWESGVTLAVTPKTGDIVTDAVKKAKGIEKYTAYDIVLMKDGEPFPPEGNVLVTLPVPEGYDGSKCVVFRVEADGALTALDTSYDASAGTLTFVTNHFSVYIVAEAELPQEQTGGTSGTQTGGDNTQTGGDNQSGGGSDGSGTGTKTDAPRTGDEAHIALWAVLALLCAGGLVAALAARKKEN